MRTLCCILSCQILKLWNVFFFRYWEMVYCGLSLELTKWAGIRTSGKRIAHQWFVETICECQHSMLDDAICYSSVIKEIGCVELLMQIIVTFCSCNITGLQFTFPYNTTTDCFQCHPVFWETMTLWPGEWIQHFTRYCRDTFHVRWTSA